jgi:SPP1 gp7 family putative phage head morphogenesis protein
VADQSWPGPHVIDSQDRFDGAVDAFRKRVPITKDEWLKLDAFERENAFTVAKVTNGRVLQDVCDAIDKAVEQGTDFDQFKDDVALDLIEEWGGEEPGALENIFRTNAATAYAEGRYAIYSSPTVKQARPYLRFDAVEDDRECDICEPFNGIVKPQEDWSDATVPLHFSCRCELVPLSQEEADEEEGIDDDMPDVDLDEGFGDAPSKHGTDWDFDLSNMPAELRSMVERSIAAGD